MTTDRTTLFDLVRAATAGAKRRHYLLILLPAALACLAGWFLGGPTGHVDPFDRVALPVTAVLLAALAWALGFTRIPLRPLEVALFSVLSLFFLFRLSYPLFWGQAQTDISSELLEFAFYLPAFYATAFLSFGIRNGLWFSLTFFSATLVLVALYVALQVLPTGDMEGVYALTQSAIASAVSILVFTIFAFQVRAHADAAVEMSRLANTDALTGVPNRRGLVATLQEECLRAGRYQRPLAVIMCDLDNFKRINDLYGHHIGDGVLRSFAVLLGENTREPDHYGRWGGEEFLIVLPETRLAEAELLARRIQAQLASAKGERSVSFTASFGVAQFQPGDTLELLIARADEALYAAKDKGRNTVVAA